MSPTTINPHGVFQTIWLTFAGIALVNSLVAGSVIPTAATRPPIVTANPNTTVEARDLLRYLYDLSGKRTLTAQHEVLGRMSVVGDKIGAITGDYPAIWGCDFGFSDERHDIDNIKYRSQLVAEIKKQHESGAIITMTYHQANPVIGEPCLFRGGVISELTDAQWKELLTPGTDLHGIWERQMDIVAALLKEVRDARIPVLFRPYHEMNGSWFWWGGRKGPGGAAALYVQLFRYFTEHHHLDNLVWVWSCDKPHPGVEEFYPGDRYMDVLGCDIYPIKGNPEVYPQEWYERMVLLAGDKPLALGEFSRLPDLSIFQKQPRWVWMMGWSGMFLEQNSEAEIAAFYHSPRMITRRTIHDSVAASAADQAK